MKYRFESQESRKGISREERRHLPVTQSFRFAQIQPGVRNAVIFTLIQNCRMHSVEPHSYLKDLLERLPTMTNQDKLDELTPLNWKKAREKSLPQAA